MPCDDSADFNGDEFVDFLDFDAYVGAFEAGRSSTGLKVLCAGIPPGMLPVQTTAAVRGSAGAG